MIGTYADFRSISVTGRTGSCRPADPNRPRNLCRSDDRAAVS